MLEPKHVSKTMSLLTKQSVMNLKKYFLLLILTSFFLLRTQDANACNESGILATVSSGTPGDGAVSFDPFIVPNGANYDIVVKWCASLNDGSGLGTSGTILNVAGANVVNFSPSTITSSSSGITALGSATSNQVTYYAPGCDGTSANCAWHQDQTGLGNTDTDDGAATPVPGGIDCFDLTITVDAYPTSISSEGEQSGANGADTAPNPGTGALTACGPELFTFPPEPTYAAASCSGLSFVDSGGTGGNYGNLEDITYYICPDTPGEYVTLNLTLVDLEAGFDILHIYDGRGTANPLTTGNGVTAPATFIATEADGCLTARFTSDSSFNLQGWESTLFCLPFPCSPEAGTIAPE